jgi:rubrerythrin
VRCTSALNKERTLKKPLDLQDAWLLAIQKEQEAQDTYAELANLVEDASVKSLFNFLSEQEKEHKRRLEEEYDKMFLSEF